MQDRKMQDQIESYLPRRSGCMSSCCSSSCERHVTVFYYDSPKSHTTTKISIIVNVMHQQSYLLLGRLLRVDLITLEGSEIFVSR